MFDGFEFGKFKGTEVGGVFGDNFKNLMDLRCLFMTNKFFKYHNSYPTIQFNEPLPGSNPYLPSSILKLSCHAQQMYNQCKYSYTLCFY